MTSRPIALAATSVLAFAATAAQAANPSEDPLANEGVIVVTAQLREQDPADVPMALSVLDGEQMERFGLLEFAELSRFVPGFAVQNQSPNNPGFVMRGITSDSGAATTEPRVSVYQDGVSISKSRGSYVELFDLERIEIAKGPQSTLYGRGALIGAVNLIQNKAHVGRHELSGKLSYGNYDATLFEGMVNAPIGDVAAVRLAGRIRERGGYVENLLGGADFNSADTAALRGSFRAGTDRLTFDLIGNYQRDEPAGTGFKSTTYNPTDPETGALLGDAGRNSGAALAASDGFPDGERLGLDRKVRGVTAIADYELNDRFSLKSITAYRRFDSREVFDGDGISLPGLTASENAYGKQFSQDLRISFDDGPVSAFLGVSYFREKGAREATVQFDERIMLAQLAGALNGGGAIPGRPASDPAPLPLFDDMGFTQMLLQGVADVRGVPLHPLVAQGISANLKPGHVENSADGSRTDAFDLFGDISVELSDRFEIGGGLRYSHDDKRSSYTASVVNGRSILGGFIGALGLTEPDRTALLQGLAMNGAAGIPPSAGYPVPLFGLATQPTAGNGATETAHYDGGGFSWRLTARYMPGADTSLYATYARGRRPEILSPAGPGVPFGATDFDVLPSETVDSLELGAKTALADRTLFVDGAAFFYQYDNFQTTVQQGTQFVTTNAGKAESYGFEGQLRYVPGSALSLFGTYAYNHSRFQAGARDGNRFRLSPDHSLSFGAIVSLPAGPGRIEFSPTLTWQSRVFFDDDNDRADLQQPPATLVADNIVDEFQDGYALVNARLGYSLDDSWRLEFHVENLFDEKYIIDAGNTGDSLGLPTFIAGAPRYYGVSASFRFGG
ncbi:outer membrane receptor protein involved in Fe transport [Altererythrobacter atlanticus]|uniref:Colicin I receptor n=1 Tax=Croceibacterium atlanticum TaxID=1267766 RepID=A0A0F7KUG5_9SPHN|nr:TonB-dependent receptor [Croceibacterium atlanticum]AKH42831.1 Colicin I receptor precursor [Croceibacterium atlanticum]MBB5731611.1 outer membrane receptor protein involved in Fe transport [Croceibacterium atlanticum]